MKKSNTDRVLRWILILEKYGPDIEYIKGEKKIAADETSRLPNNGNQETTHETTYTTETMSKLYSIKELPEGTFPLSFNLTDRYHREYPFLKKKIKCAEYTKGYFCGGRSTIDLIMYKDKIVIP